MLSTTITGILLGATLAAFVVIGVRAGRVGDDGSVDDYVVARGSQGSGGLGLSFLASGLGAWILFAPPELGALLGIDAVIGYAVAAAGPFLVLAVVGPRLRRLVPSGQGLAEFLRVRFGAAAGTAVALLSLLYMGVFVAAELVAVGGLVEILGGVPRTVTVLVVVGATLAYTAYGGLRASLRTDRWQGWLVMALLVVAAIAAVDTLAEPVTGAREAGLLGADRVGLESAATLVIAVTAANLFHQGYWQRVWAARDDRTLRAGALLGAALTVPVVLVAGLFGVVAAGAGIAEVPALSVFAVTAGFPTPVVAAVLVLGVALVASSVDTLENGLVALVVEERPSMGVRDARIWTVLLMLPVAVVGLVANSVLQLFLIADLLCAALVAPALLGLRARTTTTGVVAGAVAGLGGALVAGWVAAGSLAGAVDVVTFPDAVPTLPPFLGALVGGTLGTLVGSVPGRPAVELAEVEAGVHARRTPSGNVQHMTAVPRLHVLTDERSDADLLALVEVVLGAGAPCIQLRSKHHDDAALHALAVEVVTRCRTAGATCIVNDRADVAVAVGADGVHVGAEDLPVAAVRRVVADDLLVGATARDAEQARRAAADGADYLGVGPVFSTATKDGLPEPIGPDGLAPVVAAVDVPVLGIAGVTAARVAGVMATGAHGVAVTGAVTGAGDPAGAVTELLAAVGRGATA